MGNEQQPERFRGRIIFNESGQKVEIPLDKVLEEEEAGILKKLEKDKGLDTGVKKIMEERLVEIGHEKKGDDDPRKGRPKSNIVKL